MFHAKNYETASTFVKVMPHDFTHAEKTSGFFFSGHSA